VVSCLGRGWLLQFRGHLHLACPWLYTRTEWTLQLVLVVHHPLARTKNPPRPLLHQRPLNAFLCCTDRCTILLTYIALLQPPSRLRHHMLYFAGIKASHRSFRSTEHGNGAMRAVDLERKCRVLTGKETRYSKLGPSNPHLKVKTTQRQILTDVHVLNKTLEDAMLKMTCRSNFVSV
jgi:hypothetical protein